MKEYYNSMILNDKTRIEQTNINKLNSWYLAEEIIDFGIIVAEQYYEKKLSQIIYYDAYFSDAEEKILNYHKKKYNDLNFVLFFNLTATIKRLSIFRDLKKSNIEIWEFDKNGREKVLQMFTDKGILIEYIERFYNEKGEIYEEKYFYPSSWTIHIEDF